MTRRLPHEPEIVIANVVSVKLARGGRSWQVAERYLRTRRGKDAVELRRSTWPRDASSAILEGLSRAREVLEGLEDSEEALRLLGATAELEAALSVPAEPRLLVRAALDATGTSISETARRSGLSRTTLQDLLAGRTDPHASTVRRALEAIAESSNERREE